MSDEPTCQYTTSSSKVISVKSYRTDTQTDRDTDNGPLL